MTHHNVLTRASVVGGLLALSGCSPVTSVNQAVNSFENAKATGGMAMTVDVGGPSTISDDVEFAGFAFGTYDVDASEDSITMTLVADLENLQITQYDDTTFDRYYFELDQDITAAAVDASSDANFAATIEILAPGATASTGGTFVEGLATGFAFDNGAILLTIGDGTDLGQISDSLKITF